jgi:cytochrome b subunit of formate dehydrogenase
VSSARASQAGAGGQTDRVLRHSLVDRLIHWSIAVAVLVLLATAFLPILGIQFAWVAIHWSAGLILVAIVLLHIVRALIRQNLNSVWIGMRDLRDAAAILRRTIRIGDQTERKPGKYSFAQKSIHLAFAVVVLATIATGGLMMVKIDTPWWNRDPYWLSDQTWGVVYVVHGLAALLLITMVMAHVYFALRPEKWHFTRSMVVGWITRREYSEQHDPKRWQVD